MLLFDYSQPSSSTVYAHGQKTKKKHEKNAVPRQDPQ